jgi:hypothetical protein
MVLAISAAATLWIRHHPVGGRLGNRLAYERGPAGVAAAYGYPLRCLSVTILTADHVYARADFNRLSPCGRYTGNPTAIFRYYAGRWRLSLHAVAYSCPVDSMPVVAQRKLGVC